MAEITYTMEVQCHSQSEYEDWEAKLENYDCSQYDVDKSTTMKKIKLTRCVHRDLNDE